MTQRLVFARRLSQPLIHNGVMKKFVVRTATVGDADGVTSLLQISYPLLMQSAYDSDVLAPALALMTKAQPALLASGTYYVAESKEECIVGCGGWTRENPREGNETENVGHIRHFGTHPDWTRCGVGRAIYDHCEVEARKAGVTHMECLSSINAEGFYLALGFRRVREVDVEMATNIVLPSIKMKRPI